MDKFPEIGLNFGPLYKLLVFPFYTKLLNTSIELKVFNHLTEFKTSDAVAQAIGTHQENTRRFLDGLVAIDLLVKMNGQYQNAPIAQKFLVEGVPIYLGKFLTSAGAWYPPVLENMAKLVKKGPPQNIVMDQMSDDFWAQSARDNANYQRAGAGQLIAGIISKLPEFPSFKKMKGLYHYLEDYPWLLPVAWLFRLWYKLINSKDKSFEYLKTTVNHQNINSRLAMIRHFEEG